MTTGPERSVGHRFVRDMGVTAVGSVLTRVVAAGGGVLMARLLGPSDRGRYAVLFLAAGLAGAIGTLGLEVWVAREVARDGLRARTAAVIRRHTRASVAVFAALVVVAAPFAGLAGWASWPEVVGTAIVALTSLVSVVRQAVLQGLRQMRAFAGLGLLGAAVYLAWVVGLMITDRPSVALVLLGAAAGNLVQVILTFRRRYRTTMDEPDARPAVRAAYREALRFGLPSSAGIGLSMAAYRLDLVIVAAFLTASDVGLYAVAVALAELLLLLPNALTQVLLPHVAGDPERRDTARLVRVAGLLMIPAALALGLLGEPLIRLLYGAPFADAWLALPGLVAASVALGAWKLLMIDLLARGHSRYRATTAASGLAAMLAADFVLVPTLGIAGAGIGSLIGYGTSLVHIAVRWCQHTGGSFADLVRVTRADVRAVTALVRRT